VQEEEPFELKVPGLHGKQNELELLAVEGLNVPASHLVQGEARGDATAVLYLPTGHAEQTCGESPLPKALSFTLGS